MALKFADVFRELNKEFGINEEEVETHDYIDHFEIDDYNKIYHDGEFAKATNEQFVSVKRKLEDSDEEEVMDNNIIFDIIQQSKQKESELSTVTSVVHSLLDRVVREEKNVEPKTKQPGKKRCYTLQSRIQRGKAKHPMLVPCVPVELDGSKKGCTKKCSEKLTEERRQEIHEFYWNLSKDKQNIWISNLVDTIDPVRPRKKKSGKKERKFTRVYYLENSSKEKLQVCQKMFLSTLGLTSDKTIQTVLSKCKSSHTVVDLSDQRGKSDGNKKPDDISDKVTNHILSFNPSISHYRRAHAPKRMYISPEFNVSGMYKDFCTSNPVKISYNYYNKKVKKMNISFVKLGEEECERCDLHERHLETHKPEEVPNDGKENNKRTYDNCESCGDFISHIKTASQARESYRRDKDRELNDDELIASVDMQKVIMLPRIPGLKVVVFCKRIVLFNETFAPVGGSKKGGKATGVLWHEGVKGRSASDVASTYIRFIRSNRDVKHFIFWVDNCLGQNKNWYLFTALANEVNIKDASVQTITLKYFEPGHTFMSADSFHHKVEQCMRQKKRVEDFQDFVDIVEKCGKSLVMRFSDFFQFPKGVSQGNYASNKPKLENVQIVKFSRGKKEMFWKCSYLDTDFKCARFLQRTYEKKIGANEFTQCKQNRGVKPNKKENIVDVLCPHMKERSRNFWKNLDVNESSPDLTTERDYDEVLMDE